MDEVLVTSGLTVGYVVGGGSTSVAVKRVDVKLARRRILGVVGESGCGKSTLALTAIGYRGATTRVLGGTSVLEGVDLLGLNTRDLRALWGSRIGYVSQSAVTAINPAIPVGRQLEQVVAKHNKEHDGALKRQSARAFDAVGLPDPEAVGRRYPHQFSGGQLQRVALAIALACRPDVIILDEPTTGLDVTTQARIAELVRRTVTESNAAALYVSHDLVLVARLADEVAVLYAGEVVEQGPTAQVIEAPRHPYTQALLAAAPSATERRMVRGIEGQPPPEAVFDACSFEPRCRYSQDACRRGEIAARDIVPGHLMRCVLDDSLERYAHEPTPVPPRAQRVDSNPILKVTNLVCTYEGRPSPAVADLSFAVRPGEVMGIVGESGSGKSTLLRTIAGLQAPTAGTIAFEGRPLAVKAVKRPRRVNKQIQLVFQNPDSSLNPFYTVEALIKRPLHLFGDQKKKRTGHTHIGATERSEAAGATQDAVPDGALWWTKATGRARPCLCG